MTGHHRKHGIRLLGQSGNDREQQPAVKKSRRIYDEAVGEALIVVWEAADRICGKRLKAALPHLVESMERHGHLDLDPRVRQRLLAASAATLDRLLQPIRTPAARRLRRRRNQSPGRNIPVRTFADWNAPPPGFLEIDLVVHHGGSLWGSMIHSLVATDICTGWTEAVPLLAREQSLVVAGQEAIGRQLPFPVKGIDSDNDSVFINETLIKYCAERGIEFTRSRPYRKNDQAWIEQKNGAVVRHFVGHDRYSGSVAGQTMAHLYGAVRQYVNYFQPSFKLVEKTRHGPRVIKRYSPPATPCDRLMQHDAVSAEMKAALSEYRVKLDPVALLHAIREAQSALAAVTCPEIRPTPSGESLEQFLAKLPDLWRQDAAHTSRERRVQPPRTWRTRPDPFEGVWCDVLSWLQEDPDAKAIALLNRLKSAYPDRFSDTHLRTLQRRVQQWRGIMSKELVYAAAGEPMGAAPDLAGPPRWRWLVQGRVLAQFGYDDNGPRHALAMEQELALGVATITHHHQVPVRHPPAQTDQHLLGVVGDHLVPASALPVVACRGCQHGEKGQGPIASRPGNLAKPHQGEPAHKHA